MIKSIFSFSCNVHVRLLVAGPYVGIETNAGWVGDDYTEVTDLHVGYEGPIGESACLSMFRADPRW